MADLSDIVERILDREGGFVDHPADPGGPTKHGITLATLRRLGCDPDGDGEIDRDDIGALDRETARAILIADYYDRPGIDGLPEVLRASVFDMYVNAGAQAVRLLQQLLCDMGIRVAVDGVIGPETRAAAEAAAARAPDHLSDAYGIARRNYYYRLADLRPPLRVFARRRDGGKGGWIRRAEDFIAPRYHLTPAEHRARVASWG